MSVSVNDSGGNIDLNAIVSGGDAFLARVKTLKDATADHKTALENLRLGTDVVRAMQDVQGREQAVMEAAATAKTESEKMIADAKAEAAGIVAKAKENAEAVMSKATADADALAREVDEAREALAEWSEKTKAEASGAVNAANASKKDADSKLALAQKTGEDAATLMAEARAKHEAADVRHAELDDCLAKLSAFLATKG